MEKMLFVEGEYLVYLDDDYGKSITKIKLDKITHFEGAEKGGGSSFSVAVVEGGERVRLYGKVDQITELISTSAKSKSKNSFFGRLFS